MQTRAGRVRKFFDAALRRFCTLPSPPLTFNLRANLAHVDLLAAVPCALQGYRAPLSFDCVRSHLSLTVNPSIVLFRSFPIKTREESCLRSGRIFKF